MKKNIKTKKENRHKILMKIGDALAKMKSDGLPDSPFQRELRKYPENFWLVEGNIPNKDGSAQLFIIEDTPENNAVLSGHVVVDLNKYGIEV